MSKYTWLSTQKDKYYTLLRLLGVTKVGIKKLEKYPLIFLRAKLRDVERTEEYLQSPLGFSHLDREFGLVRLAIEGDLSALESYKSFLILIKDPFYYCRDAEAKNQRILNKLKEDYPHLERFFNDLDVVKPSELETINIQDCEEEIKDLYYRQFYERKANKDLWEGR